MGGLTKPPDPCYNEGTKKRGDNKMLEMICAIPEEIGWVLVGFVGAFALMMIVKLGKVIVEAVKERLEDDDEEDC